MENKELGASFTQVMHSDFHTRFPRLEIKYAKDDLGQLQMF
jgi:hypothetical protein